LEGGAAGTDMSSMAVAIVSFNTREVLRSCLISVLAAGASEVVVADNGSTDGTVQMLRAEFPSIVVHEDPSNPGYGSAANAAIARCRSEYVLLLNSDTVLPRGALESLTRYLDENPRVAIVGPRLRNPDGTLQRSSHQFPTPYVVLLNYSFMGPLVGRLPLARIGYHVATFPHDRARRVDWVVGAALGIRKSAFDAVGGFNRDFFMYFEEVDLAYRLRQSGWDTHFAPVTDILHIGGASTRAISSAMFAQEVAAAIRFFRAHHSESAVAGVRRAFRFAVRSKIVRDAAWYCLALQRERRREAAARIGELRRLLVVLREPSPL